PARTAAPTGPAAASPATGRPAVRRPVLPRPRPAPGAARSSGGARQLDETALLRGVIDPLRRLAVIARFGPEDIRDKRLRITVVQREPARLDLHHDSVPRPKNMIGRRQRETVQQRRVRRNRLRPGEALAIPAAE